MVAEKFTELQKALGPELTKNELVNVFQSLLKDNEAEVRSMSAQQIKDFAEALPSASRETVVMNNILPCVKVIFLYDSRSHDV